MMMSSFHEFKRTRGCPYKCIYCYQDFMGVATGIVPPKIINEMRILYDQYGVRYFHFIDDDFV